MPADLAPSLSVVHFPVGWFEGLVVKICGVRPFFS